MVEKARIILVGRDHKKVEEVCKQIVEIAQRVGVDYFGPVPLPTKRLRVVTRKSPCGDGTSTWERWEMRIHKRIIDVSADERCLKQIMRVTVPEGVHIEIELTK